MKFVKKNSKKGFTLIELVVVIAIIAVLALILVPSITGYITTANRERDRANARSIYTAAVLHASTSDKLLTALTSTADGAAILALTNGSISGCTINYGADFSVTCNGEEYGENGYE